MSNEKTVHDFIKAIKYANKECNKELQALSQSMLDLYRQYSEAPTAYLLKKKKKRVDLQTILISI